MWTENFQMFKLNLEKAEEPEVKLPTSVWIIEKTMGFQKNIYCCAIDYTEAFDWGSQQTGKFPKEMGISDHLTCLLRNLYAGQEATVRNGHGTKDCFQIGKGVLQGCPLLLWLFNLYADCIMWNAKLDESQAGIKIAGRNTNTSDMQMTPS